MGPSTRIVLDSISPSGKRLTTFELRYARFIHSEVMTHKMLSKNSASSRAIPVKKMLDQIRNDPAMPLFWGMNQAGMQATEELSDDVKDAFSVYRGMDVYEDVTPRQRAKEIWLEGRDAAVLCAERLMALGVHKQIANRPTEPWMHITILLTATEYDNFYNLRDSAMAQPEIASTARKMRRQHSESTPTLLLPGEWHLPLVYAEDRQAVEALLATESDCGAGPAAIEMLKWISAGRCARVSYLTHEGKRDIQEDIALAKKLVTSGHWSPLEHVAQCLPDKTRVANLIGWKMFRKEFPNEHPTQIEAPYIEGSVTLSPDEAYVVKRVLDGNFKLDMEETAALHSAHDKLRKAKA